MSLLRSYDLSCSFTGAIAPAYNHCQSYGLPWLLTRIQQLMMMYFDLLFARSVPRP